MDLVNWIIFGVIISPPLLGLVCILIYSVNLQLSYRKQDKIDRAVVERLYLDCLSRIDRL